MAFPFWPPRLQQSLEFTETDMRRPLAIAVGTEQLGLSQLWMQEAELQVSIPMCGVADSFNVAMATTLLMYEALAPAQSKAEDGTAPK